MKTKYLTKAKFVEEVREIKAELETQIVEVLAEFEEETGMKVAGVAMTRVERVGVPDHVIIKLEVTL